MKIVTVTVSDKGEITLPSEVRERLGVGEGDEIEFVMDDEGTHLRPKRDEGNPFLAWVGALPLPEGETTEKWLRETRYEGMSDEELRILRSGPGAQVVRVGELFGKPELAGDEPQPEQDTPPDPDL